MADGGVPGGHLGGRVTSRLGLVVYIVASIAIGVAVLVTGLPVSVAMVFFACSAVFAVVGGIQARRGKLT